MVDLQDSDAAKVGRRLTKRRRSSRAEAGTRPPWWQRRRTLSLAVLAGLVALAAVAVLSPVGGRETDEGVPGPGHDSPPSDQGAVPPGERLIPELSFVTRSAAVQPQAELEIPFFEVLADGSVAKVPLAVPEDTIVDQLRPLPDGRLLVRGSRDLMPGVARPDGPLVEGLEFPLMVVGLDGEIQSDQDIRTVGEHVTLVSADTTHAILQRSSPESPEREKEPVQIIVRNLATGAERVLWETDQAASKGDLAGDRLVLAGGGMSAAEDDGRPSQPPQCWLELRELSTHSKTGHVMPACHQVVDVNASPDGRFAAVAYERWAEPPELRLRILHLPSMAVYSDEPLGNPRSCTECTATIAMADYLGMAWTDTAVLHVTQMEPLPLSLEPEDILAGIQDRLTTQTIATIG